MKSIEEKAELWDYYQDLVKSSGFDGVTDLLAENKRLQAIINAANAQQSPAVEAPEWISCADRLPKKEDADIAGNVTCRWHNGEIVAIPWRDVEVGDDKWLCARVVQSPRITEQDAREIEDFLVEDYKREYVGQGIEAWLRSACRELLTKLNNRA